MKTTHEALRTAIAKLSEDGRDMLLAEAFAHGRVDDETKEALKTQPPKPRVLQLAYQEWYSQALPVIRQLLPDRYDEFVRQYEDHRRKSITWTTYTISDYLIGTVTRNPRGELVFDTVASFIAKMQMQLFILESAVHRIDSILADISVVLQAEMFDDELDAARELLAKGHLRAAGTLAGVTIERHLGAICRQRAIGTKKHPTIGDLNDVLKAAQVYDAIEWRSVQRIGDIRNLCAHNKGRDPMKSEVNELIAGAERLVKTIH